MYAARKLFAQLAIVSLTSYSSKSHTQREVNAAYECGHAPPAGTPHTSTIYRESCRA